MKPVRTLTPFVCALGLLTPFARGTVILEKDLTKLVGESSVIVVGTVTAVAYETDRKTDEVYTQVRLEHFQAIKGQEHLKKYKAKGLTLSFAGGLTQKQRLHVVLGMPEFELAHTYLLFLRGGDWTLCPVTGWEQGVFQVVALGDSKILLNLNKQLVVGVEKNRFVLKSVPEEVLRPKAEGFEPDPKKSGLRESRKELQQLAEELKDSIYREDNVEQLEKEDARRMRELEKTRVDTRAAARRKLRELLGQEPMTLEELSVMIRKIDQRVRDQFGPAYRKFNIKPARLPKENKQPKPPSVTPARPR